LSSGGGGAVFAFNCPALTVSRRPECPKSAFSGDTGHMAIAPRFGNSAIDAAPKRIVSRTQD